MSTTLVNSCSLLNDFRKTKVFTSSCLGKPLTLPFTDLVGRTIQLWKFDNLLIASLKENEKVRFLSGSKVHNAILPQENGSILLARIESISQRKWHLFYNQSKDEISVWPFLVAAGKEGTGKSYDQSKIDGQKKHLTYRDLIAAKREVKGEVVARKIDGKPYDHIHEVRDAQRGLKNVIARLKADLRENLEPAVRKQKEVELGEASKLLDHSEGFINSKPQKTPAHKGFEKDLQQTNLVKSYNSTNRNSPMPEKGLVGQDIGGVACSVGYIEGLFDDPRSLVEDNHFFCIPKLSDGQVPFSNEELRQILRELTIGIYSEGSAPFFSLHFRDKNSDLFPVIHPIYKNTLVGRVISLLDYFMKGYLNGGIYEEKFIDEWVRNPEWNNSESALRQLIDFEGYCKAHLEGEDKAYVSLRGLEERVGKIGLIEGGLQKILNKGIEALQEVLKERVRNVLGNEPPILSTFEGFKNSFRIIASQKSFQKDGPLFMINGDFEVKFTLSPSPAYKEALDLYIREHGHLPASYQNIVSCYEVMCKRIHDHMVKLPLCKKYFSMLGVISFFSTYLSTLKKHGKVPLLPLIEAEPVAGSPSLFPHLPIRATTTEELKVNLKSVFQVLLTQYKEKMVDYFSRGFIRIIVVKNRNPQIFKTFLPEQRRQILTVLTGEFVKSFRESNSPPLLRHLSQDKLQEIGKNNAEAIFGQFDDLFFQLATSQINLGIKSEADIDVRKLKESIGQILDKVLNKEEGLTSLASATFNIPRLPSELSERELEHGKRTVGGCGLKLETLSLQPSGRAAEIYQTHWNEMESLLPETCMEVKEEASGAEHVMFHLPFDDAASTDYQWMKSLLLIPKGMRGEDLQARLAIEEAIVNGDQDSFRELLEKTTKLSELKDVNGRYLMHVAATVSSPFFIKTLKEKGLSLQVEDQDGYLPVHYAAMSGAKAPLDFILEKHPQSLNSKSRSGATPTLIAIQNQKAKIFKDLLAKGAQPTLLSSGYTDLHAALHDGNREIIEAIFANPPFFIPFINTCSEEGGTPLMLACELDDPSLVEKLIVSYRADPRIAKKNGLTPIEIAISRDCLPVLKVLINHAEPSQTALEVALKEGSIEVGKLLKDKLIRYKNGYGDNGLHVALRYGNIPLAMEIAEGISPNQSNKGGETALSLALNLAVWELLDLWNMMGVMIPLEGLLKIPHGPLFLKVVNRAHLDKSKMNQYLEIAAAAGNYLAISELLEPNGANLEAWRGPNGTKLVHYLAKCDGLFLFKKLVLNSLNFTEPLLNEGNKTLAYIAAENRSHRILKFLLSEMKKRGITLENHFESKHLFYPIMGHGDNEMVKFALDLFPEAGFHQKIMDVKGSYPLHIAARRGAVEILELLISKGADLDVKDLDGLRPIDYCIQGGDQNGVSLLLKHKAEINGQALYEAAFLKGEKLLQLLIEQSPKSGSMGGALFRAVDHDNGEAFRKLFKYVDNLNFVRDGASIAALACQLGRVEILEQILNRFPLDLNGTGGEENTLLHLAAKGGHDACCYLLLSKGHPLSVKNKLGKTPLELASHKGVARVFSGDGEGYFKDIHLFIEAITSNEKAKIDELLKKFPLDEKISYHSPTSKMTAPPLHFLVKFGREKTIVEILKNISQSNKQFNANVTDHKGNTLAHLLVRDDISPSFLNNLDLRKINRNGKTPTHLSAKYGSPTLLKEVLTKTGRQDIHSIDRKGRTPIFKTLTKENQKNLELLVEAGANLEHQDKQFVNPLFMACQRGLFSIAKFLLIKGANPNQLVTKEGVIPLFASIVNQHEEVTRLLLSYGANCDWATKDGTHLVHLAAEMGKVDLLRLFVAKGISLGLMNSDELKPAHKAAMRGELRTLKTLLAYEADERTLFEDKVEKRDKTPTLLESAALGGDSLTLQWLLEADPNSKMEDLSTPFKLAAISPAAKSILPAFYPYRLTTDPKMLQEAIVVAIQADHVDGMSTLYQRGLPIDGELIDGHTGLHIASMKGALLCTKWLLERGADPLYPSSEGISSLEIAAMNKNFWQFKALLEAVDTIPANSKAETLLHLAANGGNVGHVFILLKEGVEIDVQEARGFTPLHLAARGGHAEVVKLLLACGADHQAKSFENHGILDLVETKDESTRKMIEDFKMLRCFAKRGETLWHLAVRSRYSLALQLLGHLSLNQINEPDEHGLTPLHLAALLGDMNCLLILLRYGPDCQAKDKQQKSPSEITNDPKIKEIIRRGILGDPMEIDEINKDGSF